MTLKKTLLPESVPIPTLMSKISQPEMALELILRKRGIHLGLGYKVENISEIEGSKWFIEASQKGTTHTFECNNAVCTFPLGRSFHFLSRQFLKPNQSKWASKLRPLSVVAIEYSSCSSSFHDEKLVHAAPGTLIIFPAHKCLGSITSLGSLIIWCWIDFEESLNAPVVKEKVIQLRRAAQNIFVPDSIPSYKNFHEMNTKKILNERVVLLPVGRGLPWYTPPHLNLNDVKLSKPGLFSVGDAFQFGESPWESVLGSVDSVVKELKRSGL